MLLVVHDGWTYRVVLLELELFFQKALEHRHCVALLELLSSKP